MGVAVVTGGAGGIGAAVVERLADDGYDVAVIELRRQDLDRVPQARGPARIRGYEAAVTDPQAVARALEAAEGDLGPVDVLVNNAGVISEIGLLDLDVTEFRRVLDVNVTGVFVCTQAAARSMVRRGTPGRIVNLASINSQSISTAGLSHYAASKGAVAMLTKASALELAPHGIRVNAVAPGVVETPLVARTLADPNRRAHFERRIPRGTLTTAHDVADTVTMLARPDLRAITGVIVPVDGGEHIGGARVDDDGNPGAKVVAAG
ncbi:SDR family NAD(P)-dependent oxidoreductase [Actinomadura formosensis]|uniref:SDR family NAD(P)-dependent oxidoreductase n=1 Tax=Actinomadura formosensis TaxID=60706 RepID=UPI00082A3CD6|nr:SDR family NAD(P)-dependent oxidoreductase [Actinomadura formosensis]